MNLIEKYGIQNGDIYAACSGSGTYLKVVDNDTYAWCDDVVVADLQNGELVPGSKRRIDAFKLHMVRYYKVDQA